MCVAVGVNGVCAHGGQKSTSGCLLPSPRILKQGLSLNPELTKFGESDQPTSSRSPVFLLVSTVIVDMCHNSWLFCGC